MTLLDEGGEGPILTTICSCKTSITKVIITTTFVTATQSTRVILGLH